MRYTMQIEGLGVVSGLSLAQFLELADYLNDHRIQAWRLDGGELDCVFVQELAMQESAVRGSVSVSKWLWATALFVLIMAGRASAQSGGTWTGQAQCQIRVQGPGYSHQETHTWTLNGGQPTVQGAMRIFSATWSVSGQGSLQRTQGSQTLTAQWTTNAQQNAPIALFVRASDGMLIIKAWHSQLRAQGGVTGMQQVSVNGVTQSQSAISLEAFEWAFPSAEVLNSNSTINGSKAIPTNGSVGPMQPGGSQGTAACNWNFTQGTSSVTGTGGPVAGQNPSAPPGLPPAGSSGSNVGNGSGGGSVSEGTNVPTGLGGGQPPTGSTGTTGSGSGQNPTGSTGSTSSGGGQPPTGSTGTGPTSSGPSSGATLTPPDAPQNFPGQTPPPATQSQAQVRQDFPVGKSPEGIAFDGVNIWVANFGDDTAVKLRPIDGVTIGTFATDHKPLGVAFDGANMWITDYVGSGSKVTKLRSIDGFKLAPYPLIGTYGLQGVTVEGTSVWIGFAFSQALGCAGVLKIDANESSYSPYCTGGHLSSWGDVTSGNGAVGVVFDGANVWVTTNPDNLLTKLRASDGANLGAFPVGPHPEGLAYDGANIWVANSGANNVTKLRVSDGLPLGTFPTGSAPKGVVFDGSNIWVANSGANTLTKLRASEGANLGTFPTGTAPHWLVFDGAHIWVTNNGSNTVTKY